MGYDFELDDVASVVHPIRDGRRETLSIDGRPLRALLTATQHRGEYLLELEGRSEPVFVATRGDFHFVHLRGRTHRIRAINALEQAQREAAPSGGALDLRAPMPGVVVEVAVENGAVVHTGQLLMTIESMKLQTAIVAPHAARIAEVCLSAGASFDQGAILVRLEASDEPQPEESP